VTRAEMLQEKKIYNKETLGWASLLKQNGGKRSRRKKNKYNEQAQFYYSISKMLWSGRKVRPWKPSIHLKRILGGRGERLGELKPNKEMRSSRS